MIYLTYTSVLSFIFRLRYFFTIGFYLYFALEVLSPFFKSLTLLFLFIFLLYTGILPSMFLFSNYLFRTPWGDSKVFNINFSFIEFRSPLLTNNRLFLFPSVTKMFQFTEFYHLWFSIIFKYNNFFFLLFAFSFYYFSQFYFFYYFIFIFRCLGGLLSSFLLEAFRFFLRPF